MRIAPNSTTLFSHIIVPEGFPIEFSNTLSVLDISDNDLIFCNFSIPEKKLEPLIMEYRDFKNFNDQQFYMAQQYTP